jgi:hypothetical protein
LGEKAKPGDATGLINTRPVNAGTLRFPPNKKVNTNPAINPPMCAMRAIIITNWEHKVLLHLFSGKLRMDYSLRFDNHKFLIESLALQV